MIVFSDFDNTLYLHDDELSFKQDLEAIQEFRAKSNLFCLATGRNQSSLSRAWSDYKNYLDYVIFDNGAVCTDRSGKILFQETISSEIAQELIHKINQQIDNSDFTLVFYHSAAEWKKLDQDTTKIRCWTTDLFTAEQVLKIVDSTCRSSLCGFLVREAIMSSIDWIESPERYHSFVDIMSINAGKANAIQRLLKNLPIKGVITIGDDLNDLAMIEKYNGYAMQNSVPEVLEAVEPTHVVNNLTELLKIVTKEHP